MRMEVHTSITELTCHADEWQLYDVPGKGDAARALNKAFIKAVNDGDTAYAIRKKMHKLMDSMDAYGASDSEPLQMLEILITQAVERDCR